MIKSWREMNSAAQNVALFPSARQRSRDWTTQELAEFYRVEYALIQSGMRIVTDRGVSDEGDPWFLFCREADGEPIVHFARTDGLYIIASPAYEGITRGHDLRSMVKDMIERHKLSATSKTSSNIQIHPAALLIVLVGAAFFKTPSHAQADEAKKDSAAGQKVELSTPALLRSHGLSHWEGAQDTEQSVGEDVILRNLWLIATSAVASLHDETSQIPENRGLVSEDILNQDVGTHLNSQKISDAHSEQSLLKDTSLSNTENHYPTLAQWIEQKDSAFTGLAKVVLELQSDNGVATTIHEPSATLLGSSNAAATILPLDSRILHEAQGMPPKLIGGSNKLEPNGATSSQTMQGDKSGQAKISEPSAATDGHEMAGVVQTSPAIKNPAPIATTSQQTANAESFLKDNKFLLSLKVEKTTDNSSNTGGEKAATPPVASETKPAAAKETQVSAAETKKSDVSVTFDNTHPKETISTDLFLKALSTFIQEGHDIHITASNGSFVFSESINDQSPEMMTATFNDGSTISIVGQHQLLNDIVSHLS